jgi:hypothetical protein
MVSLINYVFQKALPFARLSTLPATVTAPPTTPDEYAPAFVGVSQIERELSSVVKDGFTNIYIIYKGATLCWNFSAVYATANDAPGIYPDVSAVFYEAAAKAAEADLLGEQATGQAVDYVRKMYRMVYDGICAGAMDDPALVELAANTVCSIAMHVCATYCEVFVVYATVLSPMRSEFVVRDVDRVARNALNTANAAKEAAAATLQIGKVCLSV